MLLDFVIVARVSVVAVATVGRGLRRAHNGERPTAESIRPIRCCRPVRVPVDSISGQGDDPAAAAGDEFRRSAPSS